MGFLPALCCRRYLVLIAFENYRCLAALPAKYRLVAFTRWERMVCVARRTDLSHFDPSGTNGRTRILAMTLFAKSSCSQCSRMWPSRTKIRDRRFVTGFSNSSGCRRHPTEAAYSMANRGSGFSRDAFQARERARPSQLKSLLRIGRCAFLERAPLRPPTPPAYRQTPATRHPTLR